jgi:phage pi2 protein 07
MTVGNGSVSRNVVEIENGGWIYVPEEEFEDDYYGVDSEEPFWTRLWNLVANPFRYLLRGQIRW